MLRLHASCEPVCQLAPPGRGDGVLPPRRLVALAQVGDALHQTGLLEPFQGAIHLGRLEVPVMIAAGNRQKSGVQIVSVPGTFCNQSKQGMFDSQDKYSPGFYFMKII